MKSEWETLTGQPIPEASGRGWLDRVHPDDRPLVSDLFDEATRTREQFIIHYRLRQANGAFCWVVASGTPSTWPESGEFLGYLGDLDIVGGAPVPAKADGRIGPLRPPSEVLDGAMPTMIEGLADQVIHVRELAARADEPVIVSIIDLALMEIGYRLAQQEREASAETPTRSNIM